jgi:hypothetical protein
VNSEEWLWKTIAFAIRQAKPEKSEGRHHQRVGNRQRFGDLNRAQLPGVDQAQRM